MAPADRAANRTPRIDIDLRRAETQNCPYAAYDRLREEAPVWQDPNTGYFVISRYVILKEVLLDTERFSNVPDPEKMFVTPERTELLRNLYEKKGWYPAPNLAKRDDPNHRQMRKLFEQAYRASRIKQMEPFVREVSERLVDDFIDRGRCDWVREFAIPLPLIVIIHQVGAREEDMWRIKGWTDAYVQRLSLMHGDETDVWATEKEIEMQHYFQPIFERLREEPDDTLLSHLVNTEIPEWGRTLNDNELHAEMMTDTFVGGAETTTNALSGGILLLIQNPDAWCRLKAEPDRYLRTFVEEVLRLESPVQFLFRFATRDLELCGVRIPKGSRIMAGYGAANRDERQFPEPARLDLERANAASHLAFGSGTHHCLGASLARRELHCGFQAFIDRVDDFRLAPEQGELSYAPHMFLRALTELHIELEAKPRRPA